MLIDETICNLIVNRYGIDNVTVNYDNYRALNVNCRGIKFIILISDYNIAIWRGAYAYAFDSCNKNGIKYEY